MSYLPLRLEPGMDLRRSLEAAVGANGETSAFVISGIGSLSDARLRFAGAELETSLTGMFEILCLSGTLTQDGAHLHMAVANEHGHVAGGHVCYGNIVRTTAEVLLAQLTEWRLAREQDTNTGFNELVVRATGSEEFFRELELRRTRALVERDMETLNELHAPEYELITPAGRVFDRKRYLDAIEREPFYAGWEAGKMAFRLSPVMAIVRYKARLAFPSGRELLCWHTDAYENRAGLWQAVWSQATEVKQAQAQP